MLVFLFDIKLILHITVIEVQIKKKYGAINESKRTPDRCLLLFLRKNSVVLRMVRVVYILYTIPLELLHSIYLIYLLIAIRVMWQFVLYRYYTRTHSFSI